MPIYLVQLHFAMLGPENSITVLEGHTTCTVKPWFCYRNSCSTTMSFMLLRISELSMKLKRRLPPKALLFFHMCHSGLEAPLFLRKTAKSFKIKNIRILCG